MDSENNKEIPFDDEKEKLFRAVYYPSRLLWTTEGKVTSAVFDPRNNEDGVSMDRALSRTDKEACDFMHRKLKGKIINITVKDCNEIDEVFLLHSPNKNNPFHSEIRYLAISKRQLYRVKHILATKSKICDY